MDWLKLCLSRFHLQCGRGGSKERHKRIINLNHMPRNRACHFCVHLTAHCRSHSYSQVQQPEILMRRRERQRFPSQRGKPECLVSSDTIYQRNNKKYLHQRGRGQMRYTYSVECLTQASAPSSKEAVYVFTCLENKCAKEVTAFFASPSQRHSLLFNKHLFRCIILHIKHP